MVDELHMAVRETTSPITPSSMEITKATDPITVKCDPLSVGGGNYPQAAVFNRERTGGLVDEVIAAVKDDRTNTKKAIAADIASTARVQNQNDRVIDICERELHRRELTEDQRLEILNYMSRAAEATATAIEASRAFQEEQLEHSHKLPVKLLAGVAAVVLLGFGCSTLFRSA